MVRHILELSKVVTRRHIGDIVISPVKVSANPEYICRWVLRGGNRTALLWRCGERTCRDTRDVDSYAGNAVLLDISRR